MLKVCAEAGEPTRRQIELHCQSGHGLRVLELGRVSRSAA